MTRCFLMLTALFIATAAWTSQGVPIVPAEDGTFVYTDDFTTPRCLSDGFLINSGVEIWQSGMLMTQGPARNRTIVYRFHGDRVIEDCAVNIAQRANARHLGGRTRLFLSGNGLDWVLKADTIDLPGDPNAWQGQPFIFTGEETQPFTGGTEVWLRLVMDNHSGLKTPGSNFIDNLEVRLTLGEPAGQTADPQEQLRTRWGQERQKRGWSAITLDAQDPPERRAPHCFEDSDGWLRPPADAGHLTLAHPDGFRAQRAYWHKDRSPLSLATFINASRSTETLLARITVLATRDGSRDVAVKWNGKTVTAFDAASFFPERKIFFAELGPCPRGRHELRIAPADRGVLTVQEISVIAPPGVAWAPKPTLPSVPALTVLSAEYLPDAAPPAASQVVEGRQAVHADGRQAINVDAPVFPGLQRFYQEHEHFGAIRVVVRNPGRHPVRLGDDVLLNGKPLADSYVDFVQSDWDARGVVWHRLRPQTLNAGECGELYVRFRKRPVGRVARITMPAENAPAVEVRVPYETPPVTLDYVTVDRSGANLYVYLRKSGEAEPGTLRGIALDGRPLPGMQTYGADFQDGVALVVAPLSKPLEPLSFHVVTAQVGNAGPVGSQFRVLPWFFPRSSIHIPSNLVKEMNMNLGMWHFRSEADCREHGIPTTSHTEHLLDAHEFVRYILGPDEPDAADNRGGGYDRGLGSHARRMQQSGWAELITSQAPHVATWLIMNGTTRPLNWNVYGKVADISCFDPYPVNFYGADHAYVRESLRYARLSGAPRPMYACLEAFGWSAGQGVPSNRRGPLPEEWRQNVVQALGSGAKGLTSWVYVSSAGGWQLSEPVKLEMAKVNALIERIEDDLLLGTPVDWAVADAGQVGTGVVGNEGWPKERVWAGAVLCGPETLVVAVANHIPASKPAPPEIAPARDVTVTVRLPEYLRDVTAVEVTEDGETEVSCRVVDGQAALPLDSVAAGRVFVLRRR